MKKLNTYHLFLAQYFFWGGVLIGTIASVVPGSSAMVSIGALMILPAAVVELTAVIRRLVMQLDGTVYHASEVHIIIPAPSAVHIQGVFFFVLECTYEDKAGESHTIQSPLMALPKWSKHIQNGALTVTPEVTIYVKGHKTLIDAQIKYPYHSEKQSAEESL